MIVSSSHCGDRVGACVAYRPGCCAPWRSTSGIEVDFVIETPQRLLPIEVKAASRVTTGDAKGLEAFIDEYPDLADGGLLLYGGKEIFPITRRVLAAPWWNAC